MSRKKLATQADLRPSGRNLKLEIEYDGTDYCGWQTQGRNKRKKSIQETIEKALQKILQEKIKITGSGRTDAGVHAQAQVANFMTQRSIPLKKLQQALNAGLPDDIAITGIEEVRRDFHSRFDACSKAYRYTILNRQYRSAYLRNRVYFYPHPLNVKLMREESRVLLGKHNFRAFQAADKKERIPIRTVREVKVFRKGDLIYIDIEADGFLYNMARNIAGTLIEIGRRRFPEGSLKKILISKNRKYAGPTAPACGLSLTKVKY